MEASKGTESVIATIRTELIKRRPQGPIPIPHRVARTRLSVTLSVHTRLRHTVTVRAENAAAALAVMSRFAYDSP